ncbi:hypothetical protein CHGG_04196 [Chaetomium globosum CBS 148.51]|uniref:NACHT domain-containing protein n=1 Tax=Chaetomium globosum (strain ATCC 6205 / CBS 148.51 / DSM 1962 / NBRC 6347 / NRRL 1970) TaxID=306901 RepID=Q2H200_CHAGB|nr:uncharacterized protein CHGG_04196 [Chaetomium globosum CBS 148.51]EAQ87577.1 hypothetical protein CHGG_04196 [Chaetomium globosum CBS 148.51]
MLRNPAQATKSNLAGITHVISRMNWYCALAEHLLNKNIITGDCNFSKEQTRTFLGNLVNCTKGIEARLGNVHQTLQDFISLQKDAHRDDIESACRKDLRVVDPQHDMERIEKSKDELLDDAYKWILRTPEYEAFTNWDDSGSDRPLRRLLWIKGHAGTGKTMLIIGLIRQLSHQPVALSPALSFFFCQGTDTALNNATAVLRSLIWLLLQQPYLISHLLQKYKESGADLFRDQNAFIALSEAFRNMLKDPKLSPVYLAVDALDECAQGRPDLIHLISTSLNLSQKVRWLLSSRPEVDLLAELKDPGTNSADASKSLVELDTQRLKDPVNTFIDHKLITLRCRKGYNDSVLAEVAHEVRQRAENTFLWVALLFKELGLVDGWDAVEAVQKIPPGLADLYGYMMTKIDEGNERNRQRCKDVLVATFLAYRPLSLSELVVVAGDTVHLIHQSAKDYLEKNYQSRLQPAGPAQGYTEIASRSIDAMSLILRRNMYNLDLGFKPENITPPNPDPLAPIRYSCVFWADHLCSLNSDNSGFLEELTDDGKIYGSALVFSPTLSEIRNRYWKERLPFIEITAGIRDHWGAYRQTLEGYNCLVSIVAFSPDGNTLVSASADTTIRLWDIATGAYRQTLEGHSLWVTAVVFSPDGNILASASVDQTIRLWDIATSTHRQTLEGHSNSVTTVAFSPDGNILASSGRRYSGTIPYGGTTVSARRRAHC